MRTTSSPTIALLLLAALPGCLPDLPKEDPNQPPSAPVVHLGPEGARTADDLVVLVDTEAVDPEGGSVVYRYVWSVDGVARTELTSSVVPADATARGQVWTVVVTPTDGGTEGGAGTASLTVANTPPEVTLALAPESPGTDADLVVTAQGTDADGDAVRLDYTWTVDGAPTEQVGPSVPAAATERGEVWTVTVVPSDDVDAGAAVEGSVTVRNTAPVVGSVTLAPAPAYEDTVLVATVEGVEDVDADEVAVTFTWFVDDVAVLSGVGVDTLGGVNFAKHQVVRVEVMPDDGADAGAPVASEDVLIENTPPRGSGASVEPAALRVGGPATCTPTGWSDLDGDAEGWTFTWRVNGVLSGTSATLAGTAFQRGDSVLCEATPWDGEASGTALASAPVRVLNTPPTLASVTLSSTTPAAGDTLGVTLGAALDDDGDVVTYRYDWLVNSVSVGSGPTLASSAWRRGDRIEVVVTPNDGTDDGAAVTSATATAANTPPVVTSVSLTPGAVRTNDTLNANAVTTDADADTVALAYAWTVNGTPVSGATTSSLSGGTSFQKGDVVGVTVTPNDGAADGTAVASSTVTVLDSAPTAPAVALTPAAPEPADALTCSVVTPSTDADGDAVTYDFSWDRGDVTYTGATTSGTASTVPGAAVGADEAWTCSATASAGGLTSATSIVVDVRTSFAPYDDAFGGTMIAIAAGTFTMGSTTTTTAIWAHPAHSVTLTHDFWMGETEVTQAQFRRGMGYNPSAHLGDQYPVEMVSFEEITLYANTLSREEGRTPCYDATGSDLVTALAGNPYACEGYRVPTEAEWEYAARAGGPSTYAGSDTINDVAWYVGNSGGASHTVASLAPNAWGLYDMSGNAYESVHDWEGAYSVTPVTDPTGAASGSIRMLRGGGYGYSNVGARVDERGRWDRSPNEQFGFRLVRSRL